MDNIDNGAWCTYYSYTERLWRPLRDIEPAQQTCKRRHGTWQFPNKDAATKFYNNRVKMHAAAKIRNFVNISNKSLSRLEGAGLHDVLDYINDGLKLLAKLEK